MFWFCEIIINVLKLFYDRVLGILSLKIVLELNIRFQSVFIASKQWV